MVEEMECANRPDGHVSRPNRCDRAHWLNRIAKIMMANLSYPLTFLAICSNMAMLGIHKLAILGG
jgi:hypothetical protein